ncbi:major_cap_HK97, phage major capsid protein, HK97 family [uncultured Caudovirales phage]|uniref:Major_cap_HK97, phage major capsid protein, HK97 family n=1 Tax=uncultured Caudovirales phage TaxID=2100421 RepID=A0A6J5N065_9CAUD|nr:major_cap_HK97, phage major capsid protein, HK97 family [uncultured Caudovirales phage]
MENQNLTPDQVVEKINGLISEKMASIPTTDDVNNLKNEVEGLKSLSEKSLDIEKAIAKMEGKMEAMAEKAVNNPQVNLSIGQQVTKGFDMEAIKAGKTMDLEIKAPTTLAGDYTGQIALTTLEPGVNRIARPNLLLQNVVNRGTTNSMYVTYVQQTAKSDGAFVAEGDPKTEYELKYSEVSKQVKKVASIIKISKEMLTDLPFMASEVNNDLMLGVSNQIENQLLNGTGLTVNLEGILASATTFTAGTFALSVINANLADVIRVAVANIQGANFNATHVVLNPVDVAKLQLIKTTTGEYTYPMFYMDPMTAQVRIAELSIISTNYMTAGNFLVGDMSKDNLRMRETMNIQMGYVNDDFKNNLVSILCEARLVNFIKANDTGAFVKGVIATAITAIKTP